MVVITGRAGCVASARELIQSAVDERLTAHRNQQTLTLTLPQRAVGKVIGRQGANIRSIQRESGAKVSMDLYVLGRVGHLYHMHMQIKTYPPPPLGNNVNWWT